MSHSSDAPPKEIRTLDITDLERIERYRRAGYGGSVSDSLNALGVRDTVFSDRFKPLRQGMQLVGRALTIKLHSQVDYNLTPGLLEQMEAKWAAEGGHPQKRMMRAVAAASGRCRCSIAVSAVSARSRQGSSPET